MSDYSRENSNTNNILSILDEYTSTDVDEVTRGLAFDFRSRRIEKGLTRGEVASLSGVALGNIVRFEQKGLVSLGNLVALAASIGYLPEIRNIFAAQKYSTMEELTQIRRNAGKKRAYHKKK